MLLYDKNYVLLGLTRDTLELFGFESFEDFVNRYNDIDKLLLNKKTTAHFIREILTLEEKSMNYKINSNENIEDIFVEIKEFYPTFSNNTFYEVDVRATQNNSWLENSLNKINMKYDEYILYLKEFFQSQVKMKNDLKNAILMQNRDEIMQIVDDLLEPAKTLEITPIVEVLIKLKNSFDENAYRANYKEFENRIENIKRKVL